MGSYGSFCEGYLQLRKGSPSHRQACWGVGVGQSQTPLRINTDGPQTPRGAVSVNVDSGFTHSLEKRAGLVRPSPCAPWCGALAGHDLGSSRSRTSMELPGLELLQEQLLPCESSSQKEPTRQVLGPRVTSKERTGHYEYLAEFTRTPTQVYNLITG